MVFFGDIVSLQRGRPVFVEKALVWGFVVVVGVRGLQELLALDNGGRYLDLGLVVAQEARRLDGDAPVLVAVRHF